jgi:hypothetical protein
MIDVNSYVLSNNNYHFLETEKKQIVIGNTFNVDMNHFFGWTHRSNGSYKKVSNFTIDTGGKIYQHFDSNYYSEFLPNSIYNKHIVSIVLVNEGWLDYDIKDKKYINCFGNVYLKDNMIEKRWRNHSFWDTYSEKQIDSLTELTKYLLEKHNIIKKVLGHNTYVRDIVGFEGVTYRSNWIKDSTDLSPSFDFEIFKNKIEDNGIQ